MSAIPFARELGCSNLRPKAVMVQKRNRIVNAEANAERAFTHIATWAVSLAKSEKKCPRSIKNGAPGGCPTSNLCALTINSPQSQKEAVGSIVKR